MKHLKTLSGRGTLIADGHAAIAVDYEIRVTEAGGAAGGRGTIIAIDDDLFAIATVTNPVALELADGARVAVVLTRSTIDRAEIVTSGAVPGA